MEHWILIPGACAAGFLLDFIFGDPRWIYHPVRIIGNGIALGEKIIRRPVREKGKEPFQRFLEGTVLWLFIAALSFLIPFLILRMLFQVHPVLGFAAEAFWCGQIIAARDLCAESGKVYDRLKQNDLPGARKAVSMIVGRDTENLTMEGVTKAAVETVAENTSDGVTAPLIFLMIGGAPLGFLYKAVNTMDSMLGYKNEKYLYFGRFAARADDVFNFIPARITAVLMVLAAFLTGMDGKNAWKIYRRDRRKHASPNSAHTEAVCAGALDIQLAGDAVYFGKLYKKEFLGDPVRPIEPEDIRKAGKMMYVTAVLILILSAGIRTALTFLL